MQYDEPTDPRRTLLAFVETHWRELTLREARSLTVEALFAYIDKPPKIKETLTYS
jgi:hypothetical protein